MTKFDWDKQKRKEQAAENTRTINRARYAQTRQANKLNTRNLTALEMLEATAQIATTKERERIIKLLEEHQLTSETSSGFLSVCSCGEAIDDFREHLAELIKEENE